MKLDMLPACSETYISVWNPTQYYQEVGISIVTVFLFFLGMVWSNWEVEAASSIAVTTAGDLRTSVCKVVIYLQRNMSGERCPPQNHSQDDPTSPHPLVFCPKTKTCGYRGAVTLGNKYVRLNVGGILFFTPLQVLTSQNSLLGAMFGGKTEVFTDKEG